MRVYPWVRKTPWNRNWHPTSVFLPGKFLAEYSPWGCKKLDRTEHTHTHTLLTRRKTKFQKFVSIVFP